MDRKTYPMTKAQARNRAWTQEQRAHLQAELATLPWHAFIRRINARLLLDAIAKVAKQDDENHPPAPIIIHGSIRVTPATPPRLIEEP